MVKKVHLTLVQNYWKMYYLADKKATKSPTLSDLAEMTELLNKTKILKFMQSTPTHFI